MKVAVISDIHGNVHALEAVLKDIEQLGVDRIICAGDVPNPFLRSLDAWRLLKARGIPCLRGNHEDYIVSYFSGDRPEIRDSVQFRPIQAVARHLGPGIAEEFARLPFDLLVPGPGGDDLYICHASPQHNARSYLRGVDDAMAATFARAGSARMLVAGHIHVQWTGAWQGRQLVICGSVGLPHHGKTEAEYALFTHQDGEWRREFRLVPYDAQAAAREYLESGCLAQGGPIAWMLYDEIICAEPRLAYFLPRVLGHGKTAPTSRDQWVAAATAYLRDIGRLDPLTALGLPID